MEFVVALVVIVIIAYVLKTEKNNYANKIIKTPESLGEAGENYIIKLLNQSTEENYIINDIIIQDPTGKTSQIDHIVINKNGIFVIETKNYNGRIYGNDQQQEWTQVLNYGKNKNKFYNPVKQNATHIYKLREITKTKLPIRSIIVFVMGNTEYIKSENTYTPEQMLSEIERPINHEISKEQIEVFYNQLVQIKEENSIGRQEHIDNIVKTIDETEKGICPRCGAKLVERKGQYGNFYGCSNYPNCKFTKK